jgi:hypothetical protein
VFGLPKQILREQSLVVKENDEHAPDFALHLSLRGLLLCLRVITVNPALVTSDNPGQEGCIVEGDLTELLTDGDTLIASGQTHDSE